MNVYLSGSISKDPNHMEKFKTYEGVIMARHPDWKVFNPAKVSAALPEGLTHEQYMEIDFALIDACDCIYQLPGWQESAGANQEYGYARAKGKTVVG